MYRAGELFVHSLHWESEELHQHSADRMVEVLGHRRDVVLLNDRANLTVHPKVHRVERLIVEPLGVVEVNESSVLIDTSFLDRVEDTLTHLVINTHSPYASGLS